MFSCNTMNFIKSVETFLKYDKGFRFIRLSNPWFPLRWVIFLGESSSNEILEKNKKTLFDFTFRTVLLPQEKNRKFMAWQRSPAVKSAGVQVCVDLSPATLVKVLSFFFRKLCGWLWLLVWFTQILYMTGWRRTTFPLRAKYVTCSNLSFLHYKDAVVSGTLS